MLRLIAEWRSFAGVRPHRFCVALREGRKRAHLVSRLATVGLSPITGPESGGMAGCGGRQSRSSLAVPHVSGYRATTAANEDSPTPVGPKLTHPSTQEILSRRRQRTGNRLHWHSQWRWQAQPFPLWWPLRLWRPPQPAKPSDCWPCCRKPPPRADSVGVMPTPHDR